MISAIFHPADQPLMVSTFVKTHTTIPVTMGFIYGVTIFAIVF